MHDGSSTGTDNIPVDMDDDARTVGALNLLDKAAVPEDGLEAAVSG